MTGVHDFWNFAGDYWWLVFPLFGMTMGAIGTFRKQREREFYGMLGFAAIAGIVLSALLYLTNKRIWWPLKHRADRLNDGR